MKTKPFDLTAAIDGAKLVTRDGQEAKFIAYVPEAEDHQKIVYLVANHLWYCRDNGEYYGGQWIANLDLFLAVPTRSINGYEYPEPERVKPKDGTECWMPYPSSEHFVIRSRFENKEKRHKQFLKRGLVHLTREAAEAHARAIILAGGGEV